MKTAIVNGSQKTGESNTGIILHELNSLLKDSTVINYTLGTERFSPETYAEIASGDVIVFAFPLYIDSIPSNVLKMLIELEGVLKKEARKEITVYAIINNGFYEGRQTHIAFEMIENWCDRSGVRFGGGIGQGAGEMIGATKNIPLNKGPFGNLGRELALLAKKIELREPFGIKYLSPSFPRFLWKFMAVHTFWNKLARKNKLTKNDILKKLE
jgi:multimeric flavodoxin WrbA